MLTKEQIYELWNSGDIECLTLRSIYDECVPEGESICEPAQYVIRYKGKHYIEIPYNDGYDSDTELLETNMDYIIASLDEREQITTDEFVKNNFVLSHKDMDLIVPIVFEHKFYETIQSLIDCEDYGVALFECTELLENTDDVGVKELIDIMKFINKCSSLH